MNRWFYGYMADMCWSWLIWLWVVTISSHPNSSTSFLLFGNSQGYRYRHSWGQYLHVLGHTNLQVDHLIDRNMIFRCIQYSIHILIHSTQQTYTWKEEYKITNTNNYCKTLIQMSVDWRIDFGNVPCHQSQQQCRAWTLSQPSIPSCSQFVKHDYQASMWTKYQKHPKAAIGHC